MLACIESAYFLHVRACEAWLEHSLYTAAKRRCKRLLRLRLEAKACTERGVAWLIQMAYFLNVRTSEAGREDAADIACCGSGKACIGIVEASAKGGVIPGLHFLYIRTGKTRRED